MEINPMKTSNIIVNYTLPHISELFSIVVVGADGRLYAHSE